MIRAPHGGAAAAEGNPHGQNDLVRKCSCGGTKREYYISLQEPWDVAFTEYRPVGKTEERLKYRRPLFIVRARDRHLRKSVRTFSSGKVCKRVRFLRDIRGPFCYHPFPVGIRGPFCYHPFPVGTERPRTESLAPAPQRAGDVKTTRGHVQPGRGPLGVRGSGRLWAFGESLTCALGGVFWYRLVAELTTHLDGSALRDMETKGGTNLARARSHFDTKFRFAAPRAPRFRDIVRRLVEATRSAVRTAVRARALAGEGLSAVFGRATGHRNSVLMADGGADFNGGDSAPKDMERGGRINLARAQSHFDTKFQFTPPGAPCFRGLVGGLVGATRAAVHSSVQARAFEDEEFSAIFNRTMGRLGDVSVDCAAGWLTLRPRPSFFMADGGAGFRGGDSAVQDMAKKGRIDLARAIAFRHQVSVYTSGSSTSERRVGGLRRGKRSGIPFLAAGSGSLLGVVFRCAPPRAPRFRGLVKSLLGQRGRRPIV
jgi:hypothetical protein